MADLTVTYTQDHARSLLHELAKQFQQQHLCDYTLVTNHGSDLHVHRCVLAAFSSNFKVIFTGSRYKLDSYLVTDVESWTVEHLVNFMYSGCLQLTKDNVHGLKSASEKWGIDSALSLCAQYENNVLGEKDDSVKLEPGDIGYDVALSGPYDDPAELESQLSKQKRQKRKKISKNDSYASIKRKPGRPRKNEVPVVLLKRIDDSANPGRKKRGRQKRGHPRKSKDESPGLSREKAKFKEPKEELYQDDQENNFDQNVPSFDFDAGDDSDRDPDYNPIQEDYGEEDKLLFSHISRVEQDRTLAHQKEFKYECGVCQQRFEYYSLMMLHRKRSKKCKHIRTVGFATRRTWEDLANANFVTKLIESSEGSEWLEGRPNPGNVQSELKCKVCNRYYLKRSELRRHIYRSHSGQRQAVCKLCNIHFRRWAALQLHNTKKHNRRRAQVHPHSCAICVKKRHFLYTSNLDQHMNTDHSNVIQCLFCSFCTNTPAKLDSHIHTEHPAELEMPELFQKRGKKRGRKSKLEREGIEIEPMPKKKRGRKRKDQLLEKPLGTFPCPICNKMLNSSRGVQIHIQTIHNLSNRFPRVRKSRTEKKLSWAEGMDEVWRCYECSVEEETRRDLEEHVRTQHPATKFSCSTEGCKYATVIKQCIEKHSFEKHSNNPRKMCELCGKEFSKRRLLKIHQYRTHDIMDPFITMFKCDFDACKYVCFDSAILAIHKIKHNDEKPFECTHCQRRFKRKHVMLNHVKTIHLQHKPYICEKCGKAYAMQAQLRVHMVHHGETGLFRCDECPYVSETKGNFQSHKWSKHRKRVHDNQMVFTCEICGYSSDRKARFTEHMASHGPDIYTCQICGKGFKTKRTLENHCVWKHTEKTLSCDYCTFKASVVSHLREHVRMMHTHRGVKPFKCAYCSYCAATSGNCRKHIMARHKGEEIKWLKVCDKYPNNSRPLLSAEIPHREKRSLPLSLTRAVQNGKTLLDDDIQNTSQQMALLEHQRLVVEDMAAERAAEKQYGRPQRVRDLHKETLSSEEFGLPTTLQPTQTLILTPTTVDTVNAMATLSNVAAQQQPLEQPSYDLQQHYQTVDMPAMNLSISTTDYAQMYQQFQLQHRETSPAGGYLETYKTN